MKMPLLGMGTWGMGGKFEKDLSNFDESVKVLQSGFNLGYRLVDVAERYGEGLTETIVGKAMKEQRREDIFVISKVWKEHLRYDEVLNAAEGSLKRMDTPYIDLYLIHWPNPAVPLKETMRALETLVNRGLVRDIGVSNFSVSLVKEAQSYLEHTKLAANEIEYNLVIRDAEKEVIPFCAAQGMAVIAHRPFAKGALLARRAGLLESLAATYRKTPPQIALNWIMSKGITAIPKAGSREHLKENYGALGWNLSSEDLERLDASSF